MNVIRFQIENGVNFTMDDCQPDGTSANLDGRIATGLEMVEAAFPGMSCQVYVNDIHHSELGVDGRYYILDVVFHDDSSGVIATGYVSKQSVDDNGAVFSLREVNSNIVHFFYGKELSDDDGNFYGYEWNSWVK
jgi:hypothetical protein